MKRIVILGSSPAGVAIIEEVRANDPASEITLIALDGHYPYQRDAFASFIAGDITSDSVFCQAKNFYEKNNVNVILDKKISRVNVKRKIIFTDDKSRIEYDVLIMTDTPENKFPDIKGINRTGVYGYKKLKDIDQILNVIPLIDTVAIRSDSFTGLQAAVALVKRGKEVIFVSSQKSFISAHFQDDVARWLVSRFADINLRIIRDNDIDEILGDKDVKAVRIKDGKVLSAQVVIFVESNEDLKLFRDSGLQMGEKVEVNGQFRTSIDSIYAVDQVSIPGDSEPVTSPLILQEQGRVVAAAINDQQRSAEALSVATLSLNIEGLVITVLGQIGLKAGIEVRREFDQETGSYRGMYLKNNQLIGAVLINAESDKNELLRLIGSGGCLEAENAGMISEGPSSGGNNDEQMGEQDVSTELVDN